MPTAKPWAWHPGDDVIDLKRDWVIRLRDATVFASTGGAGADLPHQWIVHESSPGATAAVGLGQHPPCPRLQDAEQAPRLGVPDELVSLGG